MTAALCYKAEINVNSNCTNCNQMPYLVSAFIRLIKLKIEVQVKYWIQMDPSKEFKGNMLPLLFLRKSEISEKLLKKNL